MSSFFVVVVALIKLFDTNKDHFGSCISLYPIWLEAKAARLGINWSCDIHNQEQKAMETCFCSVCYLHFIEFKISLLENVPIVKKIGFPLSINIIKTTTLRTIFQVVLVYVKLANAEKYH